MAAINYITVPEPDLSRGIDARSAENQIPQGYSEDLVNVDTVGTRVRKRKGYQGYAGNIPVRVVSLRQTDATNEVIFTLDTSINLTDVRQTPIVVYGRTSSSISSGGPFTGAGDTSAYYAEWTAKIRRLFDTSSTPIVIANTEHQLGMATAFAGVTESTSVSNLSNSVVLPDTVTLARVSFDLTYNYTNNTGSDINVIPFYLARATTVGSVFVGSSAGSNTTFSVTSGSTVSHSITAVQHQLSAFTMVIRVYKTNAAGASFGSATSYEQVLPDSLVVNPTTGEIVVTVTNSSGSTEEYFVIVSKPPASQVLTGSLPAGGSTSILLLSPDTAFMFPTIYVEQTPGGLLEEVLPDSLVYDAALNEFIITLTNSSATARNVIIYYEYGTVRSNQVCVTDTAVTVDDSDDRPQLTIWGLDHATIYGSDKDAREGWTHHIDSYRRQAEERVIAGLGGNFYAARQRSELSSTYRLPQLYPNLLQRTDTSRRLGPLFYDTGDSPARTRGYITSSISGTGWAIATSVSYNSGTGYTEYTISLPGKSIRDSSGSITTLSSVISTTTNIEDWLTVQNMSHSRHNGTFRIRSVTDGVDSIVVAVENDAIISSDYNDTGTGGDVGVFTDHISFDASSQFIPGDTLSSEVLGDDQILEVLSVVNATVVVGGASDLFQLAAGVQLSAVRTSSVIPLRDILPSRTASTTNIVRGDMISFTSVDSSLHLDRLLRVIYINPDQNRLVSVQGDGVSATVTMSTGDTDGLAVGSSILLLNAGKYTGTREVSEIVSGTVFRFLSDVTNAESGTLCGETIQVDEELVWSDTTNDANYFEVGARWIPIEAPDDSYNLTPSTYIQHLDANPYSDQPFTRSVMVADNMYLTDGDDSVLKFDGTSIYRAGLFQWQPDAFITQDNTPSAKIVVLAKSVSYSASSAASGRATVAAGDVDILASGSLVRLSGSTAVYTIARTDATNNQIIFTTALDSSVSVTGTISEVVRYKYYFRLNAIDENNNIIASAVTGSNDHVMELSTDAQVRIRLVGLPAWDIYDYDKLEVEIYRTKAGQAAPFYRLSTLQMTFDSSGGYIDFLDSFQDDDLTSLDVVNSTLKGTELGTAFQAPLRAKYITSADNSLVLANIRDYPELDIRLSGSAVLVTGDFSPLVMTFRRDNTTTGITTDMLNTARYQWVNTSSSLGVNSITGTLGTSFLVTTSTPHGLAVGNWVYLHYSAAVTADCPLTYCGWWQVATVPLTTTFTVNWSGSLSGAAVDFPDAAAVATDRRDIPVPLGTDGNYGQLGGNSSFAVFQATRRLSLAINASMRKVDTSITAFASFTPWLSARGGNDMELGQVLVRQDKVESTTPELLLPSSLGNIQVFVNGVRRAASAQVSADTKVFPSRILVSYPNYPELFDNPTAVLDTESDSAIDVNPADGQEITGTIPFFGDAAFGAAQKSGIEVVFKSNSIYLVDINAKRAGLNPVQRIETEGLGCTAPYSIAVTKRGIVFANESGIYALRRDLTIEYIGKWMERKYLGEVNQDMLSLAQGHHFGTGRQYKLSLPIGEVDPTTGYLENSQVYVYDHTPEDAGDGLLGPWSRYTNHPATGWANLDRDAYMASTAGRVYSIRRVGDDTDYRDDSSPIEMDILYRATDMGNSGIRKILSKVVAKYRVRKTSDSTVLSTAADLSEEFIETTTPTLTYTTELTGTGDEANHKIVVIEHSVGREVRRGTYHQLRWVNSAIDEGFELAGFDMEVAGLTSKGITQAQATK